VGLPVAPPKRAKGGAKPDLQISLHQSLFNPHYGYAL
jgi:hypothetical protein